MTTILLFRSSLFELSEDMTNGIYDYAQLCLVDEELHVGLLALYSDALECVRRNASAVLCHGEAVEL